MQGFSLLFDIASFRQHDMSTYGTDVCELLFDGLQQISFTGTVTMWAWDSFEDDLYSIAVQLQGTRITDHQLQSIFEKLKTHIVGKGPILEEPFRKRSRDTCRGTVRLANGVVSAVVEYKDSWFAGEASARLSQGTKC